MEDIKRRVEPTKEQKVQDVLKKLHIEFPEYADELTQDFAEKVCNEIIDFRINYKPAFKLYFKWVNHEADKNIRSTPGRDYAFNRMEEISLQFTKNVIAGSPKKFGSYLSGLPIAEANKKLIPVRDALNL